MDLAFTEEQLALRDGVREIMQGDARQEILLELQSEPTGFRQAIWDRLVEGGWLGIVVPESYGGVGVSISEAAAVFEEYGSGPLPQLYVVASSLAPLLVLELGTEQQRHAILAGMISGAIRSTVAVAEPRASWAATHLEATLTPAADGLVLNGAKTNVPDALGATHALVAARRADSGALSVALVDLTATGVSRQHLAGFTSWESSLSFDNVSIDESAVLGERGSNAADGLTAAIRAAIPYISSYQIGSAQAAFDLALHHSRSRVQFGQPIGRFQRVQDHVVEVINAVDAARWLTYEAIWKAENGKADADAALHLARWVTAESHWDACNHAHEVHGGLGADMRYNLAKHTYLSHAMYHFLGSPDWHREKHAESLGW